MLIVAPVCLVLALELAVVGWPASSLRRLLQPGKSELLDIAFFVLFVTGLTHLATLVCSLGVSALVGKAAQWGIGALPHFHPGPALGFALFLLTVDFANYWLHRAFHSRWLWPIHRTHHETETLNPLTVFRNNPANSTFDALTGIAPAILISPSPAMYAAFLTLLIAYTAFLHSAVRWDYGSIGRWLVVSPMFHRLHHSNKPQHRDKNFGALFPIWDRAFGTCAG